MFYASVFGGGDFDNRGYWAERSGGNVRQVVASGLSPPALELGVALAGDFSEPKFNDAGEAAFTGSLVGPELTNNRDAVWKVDSNGALQLVARTGSHAPGTPDSVVFTRLPQNPITLAFDGIRLNQRGQLTLRGRLSGSGVNSSNNQGLWTLNADGELALVARTGGNIPPFAPGGAAFSELGRPVLNDNGQIAFWGRLNTVVTPQLQAQGVWVGDATGLVNIAVAGPLLFGASHLYRIEENSISLNNARQASFTASLTGNGVTADNNHAIWSWSPDGGLKLVAREGDPAPGTPAGVHFSDEWYRSSTSNFAFDRSLLNGQGRVAFLGYLDGPGINNNSEQGIWVEAAEGGLELVVRSESRAPGTSDGIVFDELLAFAFNDTGQIAFSASLRGSGVDDTNRRGIWAQDASGLVRLIVRQGDWLDVKNGVDVDARQVSSVSIVGGSGGQDGRVDSFSNTGELALNVFFTDGTSGIFVSNGAQVPEPTATLLLLSLVAANYPRFLRNGNAANLVRHAPCAANGHDRQPEKC